MRIFIWLLVLTVVLGQSGGSIAGESAEGQVARVAGLWRRFLQSETT